MTGPADGTAYLDLAGNRVDWRNSSHDTIYLYGSRFHDTIPMATLAISALCGLCFVALWMAVCCVCCCGRKETDRYLPWKTVWVPIFCMIGFFAADLANRILHELQKTISSTYLGIDVAIGSLSNIADGLLLWYLHFSSPVDINDAPWFPRLLMILAAVVYVLISFATRGTQAWTVAEEISGTKDAKPWYWQAIGSAASGMILLYAIGWAIFAASYVRQLPKLHATKRQLRWGISGLASAFLSREVVVFVFVLLYSQFAHQAGYGVQLAYLALYGVLSVVIWTCILVIAGSHEERNPSGEATFSPLQQTADDERYRQPYYAYSYAPRNA